MFNSYDNPLNMTSSVIFNNRWNNLKLQSQDDFIVRLATLQYFLLILHFFQLQSLITDAFVTKRNPSCLITQCELEKTSAQGTRYSLVVPDTCFELASGTFNDSNLTNLQFKLLRQSSEIAYSGVPSTASIMIKLVTLAGSVLGLRPVVSMSITSLHEKISLYITHLKTLILLAVSLIVIYLPSVLITITTWIPQMNIVQILAVEYQIDASFTEQEWYRATVTTVGTLIAVLVGICLNLSMAWNADFFTEWRNIHLFDRDFWRRAIYDPIERVNFGVNHTRYSTRFIIVLVLWLLNFLPIFPYIGCAVLFVLWKFLISGWYYREFAQRVEQNVENSSVNSEEEEAMPLLR